MHASLLSLLFPFLSHIYIYIYIHMCITNKKMEQKEGHILVISCPLLGHVSPLLKLSQKITKLGAKVTFLTTKAVHARIVGPTNDHNEGIRIISIPNCVEHNDDWKDQEREFAGIQRALPGFLEDLLSKSDGKIDGVIVDSPLASVSQIVKRFGVKVAMFWVSSAGSLALGLKIPHLMESKVIDSDGTPLKNDAIPLLPNMPAMAMSDLIWHFPHDKNMQNAIFHATKDIANHLQDVDWILCNFFQELEPSLSTLPLNTLPVGPFLSNEESYGSLLSEDSSCLKWLDKQPNDSVIYIAFGSTSRFNQTQLDELALGLELTGRPFLWAALTGSGTGKPPLAFTKAYTERVAGRAKIVGWAPQEAVLAHPAVRCFLSHCGWNSVIEGLSAGVPLLCWPYFADQLYARTCICDKWRVGIRLSPDDGGGGPAVISRFEVEKKVEEVMCDNVVRKNALRMKEMAGKSGTNGGSSLNNLKYLVEQMIR
ncbi:UDP-glycosyltransferase 83A1-like isoform X1 [Andrographis paniculata]|uniref:UDP-glycosyltransferase 83A1-like isoform X1 n=1 Tax=Andrographis paniculata TaxID=175694 RepID=UPI0021E8969F|nr:UDP-glycosyltransferase 83A1-like isoform X1 [Andrographis paniculata]